MIIKYDVSCRHTGIKVRVRVDVSPLVSFFLCRHPGAGARVRIKFRMRVGGSDLLSSLPAGTQEQGLGLGLSLG